MSLLDRENGTHRARVDGNGNGRARAGAVEVATILRSRRRGQEIAVRDWVSPVGEGLAGVSHPYGVVARS